MARALRILFPGAYYHVTCRGNDRRAIFSDDSDREAFLEKLRGSLAVYRVELHAYVLMSNHFHLMVSTPRGNLSEFMRHFNVKLYLALQPAPQACRAFVPRALQSHFDRPGQLPVRTQPLCSFKSGANRAAPGKPDPRANPRIGEIPLE